MQILRLNWVTLVKRQLKCDRDARDAASVDPSRDQVRCGIGELRSVETLLDAGSIGGEADGMQVHPTTGAACHLQPHGQPVRLGGESEGVERVHDSRQTSDVDRQVKIAVAARGFTGEGVDSPPSADPVAGTGPVERVEDAQHVSSQHVST